MRPTTPKKLIIPLFAAFTALVLPVSAQTLSSLPAPPVEPLDPIAPRIVHASTMPDVDVRQLAPSKAKDLLTSTEGSTWHVFQVQAPACETLGRASKTPKVSQRKKTSAERKADADARKELIRICHQAENSCKQAKVLAKKYRAQLSCSALYPHTTVWLTTSRLPLKGR